MHSYMETFLVRKDILSSEQHFENKFGITVSHKKMILQRIGLEKA